MSKETVKAIDERAKQVSAKYRGLYRRAASGKASPRAAIKAFCLECTCWQREGIEKCTSPAYPLFSYRPCRGVPLRQRRQPKRLVRTETTISPLCDEWGRLRDSVSRRAFTSTPRRRRLGKWRLKKILEFSLAHSR